jgi:hypothetical protein
MTTEQAVSGIKSRPFTPVAGKGDAYALLDATNLTTDPSGAVSSIVSLGDNRCVTLWITASADAASAYAHIVPLVSAAASEPELGDDSWYGLPERDAAATATLLTGSLPTGADYTIAPEWAVITSRPLVIRTETSDANTDEIRMTVTLNVAHAKWLYVFAEEVGGNMNVAIKYSLHG